MLLWKIYFADLYRNELITRTNLDTSRLPNGRYDLPILPVVLIINLREDHNGVRPCMEYGRNYYCLVGSEWWASTYSGLLNYLDFYRGISAVLRGGHIPNEIFQDTYRTAFSDPEILAITQDWFVRDTKEGFD